MPEQRCAVGVCMCACVYKGPHGVLQPGLGKRECLEIYLRISVQARMSFAVSKKHLTDADKPSGFYGRQSCLEFQVIPKGLRTFSKNAHVRLLEMKK